MSKLLDLTKISTAQLVTIALQRNAAFLEAEAARAEAGKELLRRGAGGHAGVNPDEKLTVVGSSGGSLKIASLGSGTDDEKAVRELVGEHFAALYERVLTFKPTKSFEDRAAVLLPKVKVTKLLNLVGEVTGGRASYVLWPKVVKAA